jgi:hypothetical protein
VAARTELSFVFVTGSLRCNSLRVLPAHGTPGDRKGSCNNHTYAENRSAATEAENDTDSVAPLGTTVNSVIW